MKQDGKTCEDSKLLHFSCDSGAPAEDRQAEPHTQRKVKETHELIFSWLSWLAVLLAGAYDDGDDDGVVAQHRGHTPNDRLTETCSLGLPCTFFDK